MLFSKNFRRKQFELQCFFGGKHKSSLSKHNIVLPINCSLSPDAYIAYKLNTAECNADFNHRISPKTELHANVYGWFGWLGFTRSLGLKKI